MLDTKHLINASPVGSPTLHASSLLRFTEDMWIDGHIVLTYLLNSSPVTCCTLSLVSFNQRLVPSQQILLIHSTYSLCNNHIDFIFLSAETVGCEFVPVVCNLGRHSKIVGGTVIYMRSLRMAPKQRLRPQKQGSYPLVLELICKGG